MGKFFFIISLFGLLLSACRSHRQVVQQIATESTTESYREVEKVVKIAGDTVKAVMQAQLQAVDTGQTRKCLVSTGFVPQKQTIETNRTKVIVELTQSGEIKATAISKELDAKVTVLEKTVTNSKSSVVVVEQKEGWLKRTLNAAKKSFNTILTVALLVVFVYVFIRFRGRILNPWK